MRNPTDRHDVISQQIFDWFTALRFEIEGSHKCDRNYVEAIVRVRVRSGFDRVLIRATIREVGSIDLDSLRREVAQLRVDEGWLVTNLWVSQSVKQALNKSDETNLTCLTFDELIDRSHHLRAAPVQSRYSIVQPSIIFVLCNNVGKK